MKNFFGSFFGSLVGVVVAGIICTIIFAAIVVSGFKSAFSFDDEHHFKVKPNSILMIRFDQPVKERGEKNPLSELGLGSFVKQGGIGLDEIMKSIKKAETDTAIKGIYMDLNNEVMASPATIEEIRNALLNFKNSKKFIYAYSEMYSQKSYYLASVADKIFLNPEGEMMFKGLSAQIMYYKNTLEKLNVQMQVFRHGKFKSAVEPFLLDKMSPANRLQIETLLNSVWKNMLTGISKQRGISEEELQKIADNLSVNFPQDALALKMIDGLKYKDEVTEFLKQKLNLKEKDKINYVSLSKYGEARKRMKWDDEEEGEENMNFSKNKLAIIYCVGGIESGKGDEGTIGSETIAKAIKDARTDSSIKAIVLRVNSPGGSALASDVIWREVVLAKKSKPVVVSMGDVAASGGYYISCAADRIFAQPNTITGSIGVFGLMPNVQKLFSEKLGINIDTVNTAKHSDLGTMYRTATPFEAEYIQKSVEKVYDTFTKRVAEGRGIKQADVDSVGQGRVWSGADALKIKLVDELGGINDAIKYAAKKANLKDDEYELVSLPKQKDPFQAFLKGKKEDEEAKTLQKHLGIFYDYIQSAQTILKMRGVQARLPFDMIVK
ncbi:MAG TPA: signal peptide peptidase SppA [Bacteroidia bacterium]|jgi:protease-4|nr:signal peptide peptidase SppA [Bacteroidia bacterium]